jgi:hypothetical protein
MQNERFRSWYSYNPTPPDGPEMTPFPYENYEMPHIGDFTPYSYDMPPFIAQGGFSNVQQGSGNGEDEIAKDEDVDNNTPSDDDDIY